MQTRTLWGESSCQACEGCGAEGLASRQREVCVAVGGKDIALGIDYRGTFGLSDQWPSEVLQACRVELAVVHNGLTHSHLG